MNDSVEARAIADVMSRHDHIRVTYMPAMIRIDGDGKMEFKMDEISEELGRVMTRISSKFPPRRIMAAWS